MLTVGIGEYKISNEMNETIITHALGSCIALIMYCPKNKYTALAHIVLPGLSIKEQAEYLIRKPSYYADSIVPKMADFFVNKLACRPEQLQVHLVGGADALNHKDIFKVGKKNIDMIVKILSNYNIVPDKMEVGGNISRTVSVDVNHGQVSIKSQNMIL